MLGRLKSIARSLGLDTRAIYQELSARSIRAAVEEQKLAPTFDRLRDIIPDLRDQYTIGFDPTEYQRYWEVKMRGLHAWQVACALRAVGHIGAQNMILADIGDSSGNHARYIKELAGKDRVSRVISVNLDPVAVSKIRDKGGDAVLSRAEEMDLDGVPPHLFLSFETIEHLTDPLRFLHRLATHGRTNHVLITVPYRKNSRFGGAHMRASEDSMPPSLTAEEVHMYEFSPEDWALLVRFAGWKIIFQDTYRQYPRRSPLRILAPLWRHLDFEGFIAFFVEKDLNLARRYSGW